jgi:SAM-dependent methyltransferase
MFGKYRLQRLVRKIVQLLDGKAVPPIDFGAFRRITPISRDFGYDRGQPIDRYYIEGFLRDNSAAIAGRVLEIGDDRYTRQFGGDKVTRSDVLNYQADIPGTTIRCDLASCREAIADNSFDCVIITQAIQMIYDVHAVARSLQRILKPGGCVLATTAGISQISRFDMDQWGEYWHFTDRSARRLFEEAFTPENVDVRTFGNVLASISFLHGLASRELFPEDLDAVDRDYQLIIAVRAKK